jgi:hypothetical protein
VSAGTAAFVLVVCSWATATDARSIIVMASRFTIILIFMGNPFLRSEVNDIGRAVANTCLMRVKIAAAAADSQGNYF